MSTSNPTEGSKAILALRLDLTPSVFADVEFKPSLLHLYQAQALSSPQTWGPPPACPRLPFAAPQHPEHWQAWDQCLPRQCYLSFLERRPSLTWQGLSQPTSSIASLHSHAVSSLAERSCHESNHAVGQGKAAGKRRWDEEHAHGLPLRLRPCQQSCTLELPSLPPTKHLPSKISSRLFPMLTLCFYGHCHTKIPRLFAIALYYPVTHKKLKPLCK